VSPKTSAAGTPPKKSRTKLFAVAGVVVVLLGAVAAYSVLGKKPTTSAPVPGAIVNLPETTVNLPNGHLLQTTVALQMVKGVTLEPPTMAALENAEIDTLSGFHYSVLLGASGKASAQAALLQRFNAIIASTTAAGKGTASAATIHTTASPPASILDVYFTLFVMQ